ncbi:hypothetical protein [Rheinheimera baltica]|uniref:hypothetical protein n=1 Tax=Rheinheimera baltica TaxID=67576 RepID=UPI000562B428|nr:hypothetical protein [Rheinheimera baltica]
MKKTAFVGTRTQYYKLEAAQAVLDHAHAPRSGFTHSQNVHSEYSHLNRGYYYHGASSCAEALDLMLEKHKQVTGKKVRSDCNVLFEHVLWLSEHQFSRLEQRYGFERVREAFLARAKAYAQSIKNEFGFEMLGLDIHYDEGTVASTFERQRFIRNVHCHIMFFNYNWDERVAPLRHLMNNGKDQKGRTNALNPNFVRMQDLAATAFKDMGFQRGESKLVTGREHQSKEQFVLSKLKTAQQATDTLQQERIQLAVQLHQQRSEQLQLTEQIVIQRSEAASLAQEVHKLKDQFQHLQQLIKQRAISAVRQFASRLTRQNHSNKPTR